MSGRAKGCSRSGNRNAILETDSLILTHFMKDNFYMLALAGGAMKGIITRRLKREEGELEKLKILIYGFI